MVDIKEALRLHALWLAGQEGGVRADLRETDLREDDDAEWLAFRPLIKQIIEQYPATLTGKENQNG